MNLTEFQLIYKNIRNKSKLILIIRTPLSAKPPLMEGEY